MSYQLEIERKFLVQKDKLPPLGKGLPIIQGYLAVNKNREVRVRIVEGQASLGIKLWAHTMGRHEYTYDIPMRDAKNMLELCIGVVRKIRYVHSVNDHEWSIDFFCGPHEGLVLGEVELPKVDASIVLPSWVGEEVTDLEVYYNRVLACGEGV